MVGYFCGFVLQKGMEDRLARLERAVSYLESFLDVMKRCEILDKDTELQYDAYLQSFSVCTLICRRQEEHTPLDAGALRNEKIRRMKLEKDCDVRLKEIHTMQVGRVFLPSYQGTQGQGVCCGRRAGAREVDPCVAELCAEVTERPEFDSPGNGDSEVHAKHEGHWKRSSSRVHVGTGVFTHK